MANQRVALVTGASRGIGRGIAVALGAAGWRVVVNYRGDTASAQATQAAIQQAGGKALALQADISQLDSHEAFIERVIQAYGRIDLLVNNAGMAPRQRRDILEVSQASYAEVMDTNLKGAFFLTQLVSRQMIAWLESEQLRPPLYIINMGSISAYTSSPSRAEYCLSKAGLAMMTRLFADRLAEYGILVYELRPGIIATDMTSGLTEKYDRLIDEGLTPLRRWGTPDDVGQAVLAIAEGRLPFSTGEVINIDGGFHLHRL
jgi:NAD(P)-dependent dehydrogenase (short-subunit alcohol dehydrogenase family)